MVGSVFTDAGAPQTLTLIWRIATKDQQKRFTFEQIFPCVTTIGTWGCLPAALARDVQPWTVNCGVGC